MARYFLKRISIEGFRGVNNQGDPLVLNLNPTKVVSVFGANGSGKSSIFEALEYAIFGVVNRLDKLQRVEQPEQYYNNKFHKGPATIVLHFVADDNSSQVSITVQRTEQGQRIVSGTVPNPEAFLQSIRADTLLINYKTFEDFVLDNPLSRGRQFSRLLGLETISNIRASLNSLCDTRNLRNDLSVGALEAKLQAAIESRNRTITTALNQLSDVVEHGLNSDTFEVKLVADACLRALNQDPVLKPLIAGKTLSTIDYDKCLETLKQADRTGDRTRLAELQIRKGKLVTPIDIQSLEKKVSTLNEHILQRDQLIKKTKGDTFQALYKATQQLLEESWPADECPLCERPWEHRSGLSLREFIVRELSNYQEVHDLETTIQTEWQALIKDSSIARLSREISELDPQMVESAAPSIERFVAEKPTTASVQAFREMYLALEAKRAGLLNAVEQEIKALETSLPKSLVSSIQAITAAKNLTDTLREYVRVNKEVAALQKELALVNKWWEFIKAVAVEFAQAEANLVRETIAQLEHDIRKIYNAIMPGAPILPKLDRASKSEHLHLMLEQFYDLSNAHAVPLLSESYRNALGLSILLAASCKRPYGGRFLVLDDVTSSFDAGHQFSLFEAIYKHVAFANNPDGLQVVVLSHDGTLRKYFRTVASSGWAWTHHELKGSSPMGKVKPDRIQVDHVRQQIMTYLSQGDVDLARKAVRQYLEATLLEIIEQVHIRVPLNLVDNMVPKEMLEAIKWEIGLRSKAKELGLDPDKVKDVTDNIIPFLLGNAWAHYFTDSTTSVDSLTVQNAVEHIDRLRDAFRYECTCTGGTPVKRYYSSLKGTRQPKCGCG